MSEEKKKAPSLRFKGFTDDWEQRKFGDLLNYERPDKYIVKNTRYISSGTPVLTANKSFILGYSHETNSYHNLPAIIFDDFTLDNKLVYFPFLVKSSAIKILTSRGQYPLRFIYELLQHTRFINEGHARHYISVVQKKNVMVPLATEEQTKIDNIFSKLDKLIALQQRKLRYLKCLTKALRQQMFVKREHQQPQLRFAQFNRRWNVCKIEELLDYKRPDKYIVKNTNYSDSGTPVLTANKSFILGYSTENNIYNKLPVIIFDDFTLENKFVDFPFLVKSSAIKILLAKKHFSTRFIYELLQHTSFINEGHARHYISVVQKTKVSIPTKVEEQNKIADNFSKIEKLCKFQQNKIDELTSLKKSLLQKIFI